MPNNKFVNGPLLGGPIKIISRNIQKQVIGAYHHVSNSSALRDQNEYIKSE